jgi:hypothetical protein
MGGIPADPGGGAASLPGEGGRVRGESGGTTLCPAARPAARVRRHFVPSARRVRRHGPPALLSHPPLPPLSSWRPDGFRLALAAEARAGPALVRRAQVLHLWPGDGWVLGRVRRVCRRSGF